MLYDLYFQCVEYTVELKAIRLANERKAEMILISIATYRLQSMFMFYFQLQLKSLVVGIVDTSMK